MPLFDVHWLSRSTRCHKYKSAHYILRFSQSNQEFCTQCVKHGSWLLCLNIPFYGQWTRDKMSPSKLHFSFHLLPFMKISFISSACQKQHNLQNSHLVDKSNSHRAMWNMFVTTSNCTYPDWALLVGNVVRLVLWTTCHFIVGSVCDSWQMRSRNRLDVLASRSFFVLYSLTLLAEKSGKLLQFLDFTTRAGNTRNVPGSVIKHLSFSFFSWCCADNMVNVFLCLAYSRIISGFVTQEAKYLSSDSDYDPNLVKSILVGYRFKVT